MDVGHGCLLGFGVGLDNSFLGGYLSHKKKLGVRDVAVSLKCLREVFGPYCKS